MRGFASPFDSPLEQTLYNPPQAASPGTSATGDSKQGSLATCDMRAVVMLFL